MTHTIGPLTRDLSRQTGRSAIGPQVTLALAGLAAVAAALLMRPILPPDALLPAVATVFFLLAGITVLPAWLDGGHARSSLLTYWDVSGLLTVAGICLAAAVEPEQLVRLIAADSRAE